MKKSLQNRIIIYPGFFDPMTMGHLNIIERAGRMFDVVIVAVAQSSPKEALFSWQERVTMLRLACAEVGCDVVIEAFDGLLVNYAAQNSCHMLLRGIRTISDFEYEFQLGLANKALQPTMETLFMMTDSRYSFLSSSLVKEVARLGGDLHGMVPSVVEQELRSKYAHEHIVK